MNIYIIILFIVIVVFAVIRYVTSFFFFTYNFPNYKVKGDILKNPVSTRRRFDVYTTSIRLKRRRMDVKTTSCAYWDAISISM